MSEFTYRKGGLSCEGVMLADIANSVDTPVYVYSKARIEANYRAFFSALNEALPSVSFTICFAVKANPHLAIIGCLGQLGAGADVVSRGEMERALVAGMAPSQIVFSGVGKTEEEMDAAIDAAIGQFNIESESELDSLMTLAARKNRLVPVAIRVNPDIDAGTHDKISTGRAGDKFGVSMQKAQELYAVAARAKTLDIRGLAIHIGSQITELDKFAQAFCRLKTLVLSLRGQGFSVPVLDLGGGLGVAYQQDETPPDTKGYAGIVAREIAPLGCDLIFEPGRALLADAGVLVSRVIRVKNSPTRHFVILDAAMNDLMRPALYDAYHEILPLHHPSGPLCEGIDVVGPVCETGDIFARNRALPPLVAGDYVALSHAGAYGAAMASTYNVRPKVAEVFVHKKNFTVISSRGNLADMMAREITPAWLNPPLSGS